MTRKEWVSHRRRIGSAKKKAGHNNGVDWKISRRYLLYGSPSILSPLTSTYFLYIRLLIVRFAGLGETILTKIDRSIRCAINLSSFFFFLSNKNTKKISFFSYIAKRKIRKMKKKKKKKFLFVKIIIFPPLNKENNYKCIL